MYYTWCPRKCWLSALVLLLWLLLGASLFNLYSQVILWESDTVALCSRERMGCKQEWSLPHHSLPLFPSLDVWVHIEPTEHTSFFCGTWTLWRTFFCSSYVLPCITQYYNNEKNKKKCKPWLWRAIYFPPISLGNRKSTGLLHTRHILSAEAPIIPSYMNKWICLLCCLSVFQNNDISMD